MSTPAIKVNGEVVTLPEHPVSALEFLAVKGIIPKPVYVGEVAWHDATRYAVVAEVKGYGHAAVVEDSRQAARREAARQVLEIVLQKICPTLGRPRWATWQAAYDEMIRKQVRGQAPQSVYSCRCGWFHIGWREWK